MVPTEVTEADAIVVLSGIVINPPGDNDILEWSDAVDRFEGGIALYKAGKAPYLIFTGGRVPWQSTKRPEGEMLAEWAVAHGVPEGNILLTGEAVNTAGEAEAVAKLLTQKDMEESTVLLVTSAFHMRRSQLLFEGAGLGVIPYPVDFRVGEGSDFTIIDLLPNATSLSNTEMALREFYGYLFYRLAP